MKHEDNLKFEICHALRISKIPFEVEWKSPVGRHDIAIKDNEFIYGIIECKNKKPSSRSYQISRYESLGIPLEICHTMECLNWIIGRSKVWMATPNKIDAVISSPALIKKWKKPRRAIEKIMLYADEDLNFRS
jgi:hypothetical protein